MKKIQFIVVLRVVATIFVLVNHVTVSTIHLFGKAASQWEQFTCHGINHFARFAVPCFLMITGYLLLDSNRKIDYHKAFKYAWRMVVILLTVGTLFAMMELYFEERKFDPLLPIQSVWNVLQGKTWKHMWYLYTLIGLYLIIPVFKPVFEKLNTKTIDIFLIICFIFVSVIPTLQKYVVFEFGIKYPMSSCFLFYLLLGGRLLLTTNSPLDKLPNSQTDKDKSVRLWLTIAFIMGLVQFGIAYIEYVIGYSEAEYLKDYYSPFMAFYSFAVFVWIMRLNPKFKMETLGGGIIKQIFTGFFWNIRFPHVVDQCHIQGSQIQSDRVWFVDASSRAYNGDFVFMGYNYSI